MAKLGLKGRPTKGNQLKEGQGSPFIQLCYRKEPGYGMINSSSVAGHFSGS